MDTVRKWALPPAIYAGPVTGSGLLDQGWTYVDYIARRNGKEFEVYERDVYAGEAYRIRVNKYSPPLLIHPIPEPSTLALLTMGAIGLLAYAWRKRRWQD